jgi:methylated-DNA-[protein]-cysteine S-methyltransferase
MNEVLYTAEIKTPLGKLQAVASDRGLAALEFAKPDRQRLLNDRLNRWFPESVLRKSSSPHLAAARNWLDAYFAGDFATLPAVEIDSRGTEFERRVWREMRRLKLGTTISYAALAARAGSPQGPRAAGNASRRNPIALVVPCHRVVGSSGQLTGYGGGIEHKRWLLNHEQQA